MDSTIKVAHDPVADAIWVTLARGDYAETRELDDRRRLDIATDGSILRIELLDVSDGVDLAELPRAVELARALGRLGIGVVEPVSGSVSQL